VNVSGNTATFTPTAGLAGSTQYTATITTAAKDAAGIALAANYSWTFTTGTTQSGTYTTIFDQTENPMSEGGRWTNGLAVGLAWNNVQTASGSAFGTAFTPNTYADNIAHLSGFPTNHYIEGVVHRAGGYNPAQVHEIELLCRFLITANNARGYELLIDTAGSSQIVRWNGAESNFTVLNATGTGLGAIADNDVIRLEVSGSTITAFKNGVQALQATDSTWTTGNPGIGMFTRGGDGVLPNFGWKSISAGAL
jgi:hypothetical protein